MQVFLDERSGCGNPANRLSPSLTKRLSLNRYSKTFSGAFGGDLRPPLLTLDNQEFFAAVYHANGGLDNGRVSLRRFAA
jgi:hypothetical protein